MLKLGLKKNDLSFSVIWQFLVKCLIFILNVFYAKVIVVNKISITFAPYWCESLLEVTSLKRESGENPELSRSCKFQL